MHAHTKVERIDDGVTPSVRSLLDSVERRGGFAGLKEKVLEAVRAGDLFVVEKVDESKKCPTYVFVKTFCGNQYGLNLLADAVVARLLEDGVVGEGELECNGVFVAAKGYGGASLAATLTSRWGMPQILISDKPSPHNGKSGGVFTANEPMEGKPVIVVDDTLDSGGSLREMADALKKAGSDVVGFVTVQKRGCGNLGDTGIPFCYVFASEEVLELRSLERG
jgi:orotate phosphoribosyltransferase